MDRIIGKPNFIQVIIGPRQVGKTTAVKQVLAELDIPAEYASADLPAPPDALWIRKHWERARVLAKESGRRVLVLDEVQKVHRWSEEVKRLWDEEVTLDSGLRVILLGSSSLLIQKGLSESLAGRFEVLRCLHWDFQECRECFGWDLDQYIFFGGYPGAAALIHDESRWANYVVDSLVETAVSKNVLLLNPVEKPALLRRLFILACEYGGQIVSYQKMLGQLSGIVNTTTIAHYQHLLEAAYLIAGLGKYSGSKVRMRNSSPKWLPLTTTLISALSRRSFQEAKNDTFFWGRLVECAVGSCLFRLAEKSGMGLFYWREGNYEVDFILQNGKTLTAIEVKSGYVRSRLSGMDRVERRYPKIKRIVVGSDISIQDFLKNPDRVF
jgi:predicted AAA+ superfamily ATPase